ncbi:hypothetical protein GCM10017752_30580 [Streptomyces roseoviridis]
MVVLSATAVAVETSTVPVEQLLSGVQQEPMVFLLGLDTLRGYRGESMYTPGPYRMASVSPT